MLHRITMQICLSMHFAESHPRTDREGSGFLVARGCQSLGRGRYGAASRGSYKWQDGKRTPLITSFLIRAFSILRMRSHGCHYQSRGKEQKITKKRTLSAGSVRGANGFEGVLIDTDLSVSVFRQEVA